MAPSQALTLELGASWKRWASQRTAEELADIAGRCQELLAGFGQPHRHAGLGIRKLHGNLYEFRAARGLRVGFYLIKPRTIRLAMCGNHEDVANWLKANS